MVTSSQECDITLINAGPNVPRTRDGRLAKPPPLGVLCLASHLRELGWSVQVLDYQLNQGSIEEQLRPASFVEFVEARAAAEFLGVSTMGGMLPVVLLAAAELKRRNPERTLVLGGSGPSNVAARILETFPDVDVVVRGEGEETLAELLACAGDRARVAGINYRQAGEVGKSGPRPRIRNLDAQPLPAYDAVDMDRYLVANIYTSRGCPFDCTFCEVPSFWGRHVTKRSVDGVLEEVELLRKTYGKRRINITDDTFVQSRPRVIDFCRTLLELELDVEWECFGRVDLMDDELMEMMVESGCKAVFFGIESGSNRVLEKINKRFTVDTAREIVTRSLRVFPDVYTSFVWGFPFESMDDFYETVLLMVEFGQMGARVQRPYLSLRPFSPLYQAYRDQMAFSDELPLHFLEVPRAYIPEEILELVHRNPLIFPGYHYVDAAEFPLKRSFMRRLEALGDTRWQVLGDEISAALLTEAVSS